MPLGTGLASQVVVGEETTWATAATPDHAYEFDTEGVAYIKNILQGTGLHAGGQYNRTARRVVSTVTGSGDVQMEHAFNKMGFWWKKNLGAATTPSVVVTGAYKTVFTPAGLQGTGITYQKGVPETSDGTVIPLTFSGGKVGGWEFSVAMGAIATLKETLDFQTVSTATALVTPSYVAGNGVFNFSQAVLKVGGTATTTSGVTSISGGTQVQTVINTYTLTGGNPMKVDRYGLGNAGLKKEQLENDYRSLGLALAGEFYNRTEFYDVFKANTAQPVQLTFTGPFVTGTTPYSLDIILSSVFFDTADNSVGGPDVVPQSIGCTITDDATNNVIQVTTVNADSTI